MANIKFSQFTAEADIANFDDIVGYAGAVNTRITPANLASSLITLSGGPYLPLTAGASEKLTGDLNLAATGAGPSVGSQAIVFNGVDDTGAAVIAAKIFTVDSSIAPSGQDLSIDVADDNGVLQNYVYINADGQVGINTNAPNFTLDCSGDANFSGAVGFGASATFNNDIVDISGTAGSTNFILTSNGGGGGGVTWENPTSNQYIGYKAIQVFQWPNGTPVPYTNWTNGVASNLPFNPTALIEVQNVNPGGPAANYLWLANNNAGGTAGQQAVFTLNVNGGGTWKVRTCQHWFDQTAQVEIRVSFDINGTLTDVIDEKSTELSGDKIFYGELVSTFSAGDTLSVNVEFVSGGVNPFPSATGNRPIEISFERIV